ncbi:Type II secretion system protein E [Poriferisphaera corsica]|uniref:Type II secretion system protein E n=1 Tax=Poriferisphaera corsica TaxID=2528020 RepID=A0A517YXH6_9BACT|nr:ATPase, T2SS/T4P/T4SS family [Poriferisphaera corsica]QDU34924.1 Type II secretion system protein E [Poriferisphaera corsica]
MINTLLQADNVFLMSLVNPVLFLVALGCWAWVVSSLDKDAEFYYLPRPWTNLFLIVTGAIGLGLMLLIPFFILGFILGLCPMAGGVMGYAYYRNTKVPEKDKWSLSMDTIRMHFEERAHAKAQKSATLSLIEKDGGHIEVPSRSDPRLEAHEALENVLDFAVPRRATQVDLVVDANKAAMVARIDGVKYPQPALEPQVALKLIDYVKEAAGMDVEERRKKQQGTLRFSLEDSGMHEVQLLTMGSTRGVSLTMTLDDSRATLPLDELGLIDTQAKQLHDAIDQEGRVIVVSTPPKMGSTTTLYSLTQIHDPYIQMVVTMEDQEIYEMEGVSHTEIPAEMTVEEFNHKLRAILRSDPNVVMINRIPAASTLGEIVDLTEDIRFYLGMAGTDTFSSLNSWIDQVGNKRKAADAIGGVVTQRLMRKLCETCRTAYTPDPAVLKKMNLPSNRVGKLYKASGQVVIKDKAQTCPMCHGIGYRGRIAVFEVMPIDDVARHHIAKGEMDKLKSHLRKQKMLYLQEAALAKVVEGVTDIKEVTRALSEKSGGVKRAARAKAKVSG